MTAPIVLGADVGGTKTRIGIARFDGGKPTVLKQQTYSSREHASLESILETFLAAAGASGVTAACFAVAGPVDGGRARLTNLPWQLDASELKARFGFPARLINDFAAAGAGIAHLKADDLVTLQSGLPEERGERLIIGAGTGLGVAVLTWIDEEYCVYPSEGGHADFAPVDDTQDQLLLHLRRELGHVSYERVISGPALPRVLEFVGKCGMPPSPPLLEAMEDKDASVAITSFALAHRDPAAVRALDIFVTAYGAFAGNLALVTLARGGVYVAGGIAPKIADKLKDGGFMNAFLAKGRMRKVLETIPVHVVMNTHVGLLGALTEAARVA